jgi:capsular exopolysaccharide synthesis family protein
MELAQYLAPIRKWWWLLLASVVLAAVSSYFVVQRQPFVYQAKATLMVGQPLENPNPGGAEFSLGQQLASTYVDIAQRQPIRARTKEALGLDWLPDYFARQIPQSQLIEIVVNNTNPELTQAVANELANQLILQSPTAPKPEDQEREAFISDQLNNLQSNIEETQAEINIKADELERAFSAREIADLRGEITALQSKLSTLQSNYANLLANTQSGAVNTLTIIEAADLPTAPIGPDKIRTIMVASVIALTLAAGTAYLLEYLDDTIKDPDDIKHMSNLPTLAGIPKISSGDNPASLVAFEQPRNPGAEAFRALRATTQYKISDHSNGIVLFTSTNPKEGKSLVTANFAIVLAQAGHRTLVVDADLRRPVQHKLFRVPNNEGLAELLLNYSPNGNNQDVGMLLEQLTIRTAQEGLSILSSGGQTPYSHQLLSLETMKELLSVAAAYYDYVVVDSPPLLAAADALILSSAVDGVVLVAYAGKTRRRDLKLSLNQLQDVNANVIGVVLNHLNISQKGYYRYHEYYEKSDTALSEQGQSQKQSRQQGAKPKKLGKPRLS